MKKYHSLCPIETTLNLIGNKWKILIIRDLLQGTKRFGELRKSISFTKNQNISQNVLTQNLRELEEAKLIKRKVYAEVPPKVEYSLTSLGNSLESILKSLENWGNSYKKYRLSNKLIYQYILIYLIYITCYIFLEIFLKG
ncbi:helix-turn-helix transcriptional regulator [Campylobacter jejuni]|nr:helix-turn-helix transcriptional regulator [Campylobacter jejuni]